MVVWLLHWMMKDFLSLVLLHALLQVMLKVTSAPCSILLDDGKKASQVSKSE
jgi:hypothetical protein